VKTFEDRLLFFAVLAVGLVGALFFKTVGEGDFVRIVAPLIVTVGLQIAYAVIVLNVPRFLLREDRAGDSFYYLGFLFTLGSLGHTLFAFGRIADDAVDSTNVISGFGVALATTIVGLALRVLVQQFRSDPVEIEHEVRASLAQVATQLTHDFSTIISDVATFRQSTKQVIEEGMQEAAETTRKAMTEATGQFVAEVGKLVSSIDATFSKFVGSAEEFANTSKGTVSALSKLAARIDKIEPPSNVVEVVFGPARDGMKKAADSLTESAEAQKEQLNRLGQLVTLTIKGMEGMQTVVAGIQTVVGEVDTAVKGLKSAGDEAAGASKRAIEIISSIGQAAEGQRNVINQLAGSMEGAPARLQDAVRAILESHESFEKGLKAASEKLVNATNSHSQELQVQMEKARSASGKIVDGVIAMADTMNAKLGAGTPA